LASVAGCDIDRLSTVRTGHFGGVHKPSPLNRYDRSNTWAGNRHQSVTLRRQSRSAPHFTHLFGSRKEKIMNDQAKPRVALYTFGLLRAPLGAEELREFAAMSPLIYAEAGESKGFVASAVTARPDLKGQAGLGADYGPWGVGVPPRFYTGSTKPGEVTMIQTLSLWQDVEAARGFVYDRLHKSALKRRYDWFVKGDFPGYVLWWVAAGKFPTWGEGARNLEALADHGPAPSAFTFPRSFDAKGAPALRAS
jgi:uncharacterized protein DUF3291